MGAGGVGTNVGDNGEGVAPNFSWANLFSKFMKHSVRPDYRRKLPHYLPNDAPYFVTTRLAGSLSPPEIARLKALRGRVEEARFFLSYDESLDKLHGGIDYLRRQPILDIVQATLMELEEKRLVSLHAFSVMPNHIHLVMDVVGEVQLFDVMKLLKGATSRYCNKLLDRVGNHFWQYESYDHVVRRGSLERIIRYVILNPMKAGLVTNWWEWPGTYLSERYDALKIISPN